MALSALALWLVCALGAVVFAAGVRWQPMSLAISGGGFALVTWVIWPTGIVSTPALGLLVAVVAGRALTSDRVTAWLALAAGACAAGWGGMLTTQGMPVSVSLALAVSLPMATMWWSSTHPSFAPSRLRDEALLFVGGLAIVTSALPGVVAGWGAAGHLAQQGTALPAAARPVWVMAATLVPMLLGAVYGVWNRR